MNNNGEIIIYQSPAGDTKIDVIVQDETVWLSQIQMAELFQTTKQNISLHIKNVYDEGELETIPTVKEYLTVQKEGTRNVKRTVQVFNLDVIISVGYRVKSHVGTHFRQWATRYLRELIIKGFAYNISPQYKPLFYATIGLKSTVRCEILVTSKISSFFKAPLGVR